MSRFFSARLLATALAVASPLPLMTAATPATAQVAISVSFDSFHAQLAPYGRWFRHARWGDVWVPRVADFRPYYRRGHWVYTDAGWMWVSDYRWGNIAFHYGRWVYDPGYGWLWVPGYTWGPSWVIWRQGDGYVGWFPMPPDNAWLAGDEIYTTAWTNYDRAYGYLDWYGPNYGTSWLAANWVFVPETHFIDTNYVNYAVGSQRVAQIIGRTRDVTNYTTVNDHVVNRSIDPAVIQRATGHAILPVQARNVLRANAPMDPVSTGRRIQSAEIGKHGGDPRAPANAKAVPLNAAAAARVEHAPAHVATRAEHGPAQVAAPHNERAAAPRMREAHNAPHAAFAPQQHVAHFAAPHERGPAMAFGGPRGAGGGPHFAAPHERGPAIAFGAPPGGGGGGGPHGGGGGGPHGGGGGGGGGHGKHG